MDEIQVDILKPKLGQALVECLKRRVVAVIGIP